MKVLAPLPFFVYGTLRPGESNYQRLLAGQTLWEHPARVNGRLYQVWEEDYPYLLPETGTVQGELIEIHPERYSSLLPAIDNLEDYIPGNEAASLYLRRPILATLSDGRALTAWVYLWNSPLRPGTFLPHGNFKRRNESLS